MRKVYLIAIPVILLAFLIAIAAGCQPERKPETPKPVKTERATASPAETPSGVVAPLKAGDMVAAPWGGGLYLGQVKALKGETADVEYVDDKQVRPVKVSELIPVTRKTWKAGDKVMAVWSAGKFYPGTVEEVKPGDKYLIKWDDGSNPSEVEADKIMAPPGKAPESVTSPTEATPGASPEASPEAGGETPKPMTSAEVPKSPEAPEKTR